MNQTKRNKNKKGRKQNHQPFSYSNNYSYNNYLNFNNWPQSSHNWQAIDQQQMHNMYFTDNWQTMDQQQQMQNMYFTNNWQSIDQQGMQNMYFNNCSKWFNPANFHFNHLNERNVCPQLDFNRDMRISSEMKPYIESTSSESSHSDSSNIAFELTNLYYYENQNSGEIDFIDEEENTGGNSVLAKIADVSGEVQSVKKVRIPKKLECLFDIDKELIADKLKTIYEFLMDASRIKLLMEEPSEDFRKLLLHLFFIQHRKIKHILKEKPLELEVFQKILLEIEGNKKNYMFVVKLENTESGCGVAYFKHLYPSFVKNSKVISKNHLIYKPDKYCYQSQEPQPNTKMVLAKKVKASERDLIRGLSKPVESSKAEHMMKLMGYSGGGLGPKADGIKEPIMPHLSEKYNAGLGYQKPKPSNQIVPNLRKKQKHVLKRERQEGFKTNVLQQILDFVLDDSRLEIAFDTALNSKERRQIHAIVGQLRDEGDMSFDTMEQMELVNEIKSCSEMLLYTESQGEKCNRQLFLYKSPADTVYLISPGYLVPQADSDMAIPREEFLRKTLLRYFAQFMEDVNMRDMKFVGLFPSSDLEVIRWFVSEMLSNSPLDTKSNLVVKDDEDKGNWKKYLGRLEQYTLELNGVDDTLTNSGHFHIVKTKKTLDVKSNNSVEGTRVELPNKN